MKTVELTFCISAVYWSLLFQALGFTIPCPKQCSRCYRDNTGDLVKVICSDVVIPSLPETIQHIQVSDAVSVKTLPLGQLKAFMFTKRTTLQTLTVQSYKVTSIEDGCFKSNVNLKTLDLSKNIIKSLSAAAFEGLVNLTFLNLNQNKLTSLKGSIFIHMSKLQELRLALNQFEYIGKQDFLGLNNLIKLNLQANKIVAIHSQAFDMVSQLQDLNLQHNELKTLEAEVFKGLNSLQTINLQNNQIISPDPCRFTSKDLTVVNLSQNNISMIPTMLLKSISSKQLEVNLARNTINEVKKDDLSGVYLKTLYLVLNEIWNIEPYALEQSDIDKIDLEQNKLVTLSSTVQSYLNKSNVIRLGNNPWSCDCNIQWLAKYLKTHLMSSQPPVCAKPAEFHGKTLTEVANDLTHKCKKFTGHKTSLFVPPKHVAMTPELHTVPPTYPWVTPRLRSTTVSTTTVTKATTNETIATKPPITFPVTSRNQSPEKSKEQNKTPVIIGICVSVLIILCVICGVIAYRVVRARAVVDTELSVQCRRPDVNYKPRMSRIGTTWFDEVT